MADCGRHEQEEDGESRTGVTASTEHAKRISTRAPPCHRIGLAPGPNWVTISSHDLETSNTREFLKSGPRLADALAHPKRVFDLTEGLIRRGYSDRDIELVLGGNFERVLAEIWNA